MTKRTDQDDIGNFYQQTNILGEVYEPMQTLRHTEIPTFMRTPFVTDLDRVDIGIIGIPYDGGLTFRTGARHGPREVRNESSVMRSINVVTGARPYEQAKVADIGDVQFRNMFTLDDAIGDIERYYDAIAAAGVIPLGIGGDHSVTWPILKALAKHHNEPIAVIHIDSHTDTWSEFAGSKFHHGAPFRLATEAGVIDPTKTIQIGIRGGQNVAEGLDYSRDKGMRLITIEEFEDLGWQAVAQEARRVVGDSPVYLTFDIDGLDPAYAPGTGTPEPGGLTMREAQRMLREFSGLNFIGGDMVEVSPPFDPSGFTALNGATIAFEILCLLAEKVASQRG
ncbi:MAG: agmatinase [Halioglobus sp.]